MSPLPNRPATWMEQEMLEAPGALARLQAALGGTNSPWPPPELLSALQGSPRIVWLACGSSHHASAIGRYALAGHAAAVSEVVLAHEARALSASCFAGRPVCVAMSQSGETLDTLDGVDAAKVAGCTIVGVANVPNSTLLERADYPVVLEAGTERSVPATKSFLSQCAFALHLAAAMGDGQLTPELAKLPALLSDQLASLARGGAQALPQACGWLAACRQAVLVGSGPASAVAAEGALKLREAAYLPAQSFALGEIKHGPMAMLDGASDVLVALVGPNDGEAEEKNLRRLLAIGVRAVFIGPLGHPLRAGLMAQAAQAVWIPTEPSSRWLWPLVAAAVLQRVSLDVALLRQAPVDTPRYLVKQIDEA